MSIVVIVSVVTSMLLVSNAIAIGTDDQPVFNIAATTSATGTFSAVQSGTTDVSSISVGPSPDPLNTNIKIDIRIDGAANVWGWSIPTITWNPQVLKLTKVTQGSWLSNNAPGGDPTSFVGSSSSLFDNTNGKINGGLTEAITGSDQSVDSSGVVATLTFQVIGYGSSGVNIAGGFLHTVSDSSDPKISVTCNSASVSVNQNSPSPTPTSTPAPTSSPSPSPTVSPSSSPSPSPSPTATPTSSPTPSPTPSVTPSPSPSPTSTPTSPHGPVASFTPSSGTVFSIGSEILLDASASTPGFDTVNCPITAYTWLVQYPNSTVYGSFTGQTATFYAIYVTSLKITLTVKAPDLSSSPSTSYSSTSTSTITIIIQSTQNVAQISTFNDKNSQSSSTVGLYCPQDLVKMYALVTYSGAPVASEFVSFALFYPNGTIYALNVRVTNETGYASWEFRLPWPDSNPESLFGNWTVLTSVKVASVVVTGTMIFTYNYPVGVSTYQFPSSIRRNTTSTFAVTILSPTTTTLVLSVTVCDEQQVIIASKVIPISLTAGTSTTISIQVYIPSWAYVGKATIYSDLLTDLPTSGGVPCYPEKASYVQITA